MRVRVRGTGLVAEQLRARPGTVADGAVLVEVPAGSTITDVLARLHLPGDRSYLVSVNDQLIPATAHAQHQLADDDTVLVMPPLRGG